MIIRMDI